MRLLVRTSLILVLLLMLGGIGWAVAHRLSVGAAQVPGAEDRGPAPVEVAPVRRGPIELRRTFSGTIEARAEFVVAPKVGGRVERLAVDLADTVRKGQVVAELDDDEFEQAVAQAEADLAVARANVTEAENALAIAQRELDRMRTLRERGVASESQLDTARADHLAKESALEVARAQATRAEAQLETARIRLGYTQVTASWSGEDEERVVAERYVDEGDTVSANAQLLSIVNLDPINGVVYATERDYGQLREGQAVTLVTDAYADRSFEGRITRIAPVFRQASRQARVELVISNPDRELKPGMFIRATVVLNREAEATIVPLAALTRRGGRDGVFVVDSDGDHVAWRAVRVGIREGQRVQVVGEGVSGRVVTLGQQLIDDGSAITIPDGGGEAGDGAALGSGG